MGSTKDKEDIRKRFLVVDGHSLAFRAFFALPVESFTDADGHATNAVWGFFNMLSQVITTEQPDYVAVAFDVAGGTFRNQLLPQYKGTREAAPEDLLSQLPIIQELLKALGIVYIEKPGYEGDDIIGTLASMGEAAGCDTLVLSGDRDAFQLIDDHVTVLYPGQHFKDLGHMTPQSVMDKYKVTPQQYPDLAAMRGEGSDNIPGVPGVGDGYAAKWINQFGSLEAIFQHADEIGGKKGEALRANIDQVRLNRRVNAIVRDLDLGINVADLTVGGVDEEQSDAIFTRLQFGRTSRHKILNAFKGKFGSVASHKVTSVRKDGSSGQSIVTKSEKGETGDDRIADADEVLMAMPAVTRVRDSDTLESWYNAAFSKYASHTDVQGDGTVVAKDENSSIGGDGSASGNGSDSAICGDDSNGQNASVQRWVDRAQTCSQRLERLWILLALGDAKPGQERLNCLLILVGDELALIPHDAADACKGSLEELFNEHHDAMVVHGYKESLHLLASVGIDLPMPLFDTKLAGYLVDPDFHADDLDQAARHFLGTGLIADQQLQGQLDLDGTGAADEDEERQVKSAVVVRALAQTLKGPIDERRQFGLLRGVELPVSQALFRLESAGAKVDLERLHALLEDFSAQAAQAKAIAWQAAGHEVNLQSPKQLRTVLFDEMHLKPFVKTKAGAYTTNAETLQSLYVKYAGNEQASDFLGALLQHRETNKLKQIVQTLLDSVNMRDVRIHTTFEQTVAATGRLSSVDPNLQNIPNRNAQGREIRSGFVPGEGFDSLLSCDYSQVELRIMAHLSGDEALIKAFKSGTDFHKYVASLVYGVPVDQISSDQRTHVKAMSYGLAYGLSTYGLAKQLRISPAEADVLKSKYFATFGKVHDYLESLVAKARVNGYTETMFGRRRYFPGLKSSRRSIRDAAERGALNAPIQGSAADIMKVAMVRADRALRKAQVRSRVILQIHDELVLEVAPGERDQVSALVRDAMEHAVDLAVPLDVSIGVGSDWQDAAH